MVDWLMVDLMFAWHRFALFAGFAESCLVCGCFGLCFWVTGLVCCVGGALLLLRSILIVSVGLVG